MALAQRLPSGTAVRCQAHRQSARRAVVARVADVEVRTALASLADEAEWQAAIAETQSTGNVMVVDYYTQWCGPCKLMAPKVEELAQQYEGRKIRVYKMDLGATNENKKMAMRIGIKVLPTFRFYRGGDEAHFQEMTGAKVEKLQELIEAEAAAA